MIDSKFYWSDKSIRRNTLTRKYEPLQPYVFLLLARTAQLTHFIDIGSNVGYYSVVMSLVDTVQSIYAYEPSPSAYRELVKNVRLNKLTGRVRACQKAVSSQSGKQKFGIVSKLSGANSFASSTIHTQENFASEIYVDVTTLDEDFVDVFACRCGLKIDVEGHEYEVISGAERFLCNNTILLQIEQYKGQEKVKKYLEGLGYTKIYSIGPDQFYTNSPKKGGCEVGRLSVLEAAIACMIENSVAHVSGREAGAPIRRSMGDVCLEVSGRTADVVRQVKRRIGRGGR